MYAFEKDLLYLRPKIKYLSNVDAPWYEEKPVGRNSLGSMMKDMSTEAGIAAKTNHSLRATGANVYLISLGPSKFGQNSFIFHPISK